MSNSCVIVAAKTARPERSSQRRTCRTRAARCCQRLPHLGSRTCLQPTHAATSDASLKRKQRQGRQTKQADRTKRNRRNLDQSTYPRIRPSTAALSCLAPVRQNIVVACSTAAVSSGTQRCLRSRHTWQYLMSLATLAEQQSMFGYCALPQEFVEHAATSRTKSFAAPNLQTTVHSRRIQHKGQCTVKAYACVHGK